MHISITEAEQQLDDLILMVEAGEEVILTRDGEPVARLKWVGTSPDLLAGDAEG